jgi:mono/diheme cytochrome c family protein
VDGWAKLTGGRRSDAVGDIDVDPDGRHIWAILRCDAGGDRFGYECLDSNLPVVVKFAPDGNAVAAFGGGLFIWPHGLEVDPQGNVWVTDAATIDRTGGAAGRGRGHQVVKFSPSGEVLMRLGTPGVPGNDATHLNAPSDVVVAPSGDIFVADGHGEDTNNRVVKFKSDWHVRQGVGSDRVWPGRVPLAARCRHRLARPPVRGRPREQPDPAVRSGRQVSDLVDAVRPAERHLLRSPGPYHRGRLRVRRHRESRLGHGDPHRRRGDRARCASSCCIRGAILVSAPAPGRSSRSSIATATSTAASRDRAACRNTCGCGRDYGSDLLPWRAEAGGGGMSSTRFGSQARLEAPACALMVALALAVVAGQASDNASVKNPLPASPESVAAGQQLYLRHCASCHGRNGQGGPGNDLIPPAPGLLGDRWEHGSSDGEIFANIRNGVAPDFNMVPFKDKLKDDEIWSVVNYIRSIAKK